MDGGYGNWSSYDNCTKTCGSGTQQRNRTCNNPTPMHGGKNCTLLGTSVETRTCNSNPCPGKF